MKYPVQHGCGKYRITHHLSPLGDLLVGREDDRSCLVGIAYESEKAIGLGTADRCVSNLIQDHQLSFADVLEPEAGAPFDLRVVKDLDEISHSL